MTSERAAVAAEIEAGLRRIAGPVAVGVDVEPVDSFRRLAFVDNRRLYERLFTAAEIAYCQGQADPAQHFAARFAAKEAVLKAGGAALGLNVSQVEVVRRSDGEPVLRIFDGGAGDEASFRVSLGHTHELAYAVAVMAGA
ncbi:MAG: 4'-phosphopantetheinyl transferase superfamily protein [Dehalococcoidia bacterium]|nr:4'-phosphopantetheinyl transferase superfamily protein [Dehalococcoidia bacterium]